MKKTSAFFVLIILSSIQLYSQDDGSSAKDILTKYIHVIGGKEKILNISSYKIIKESSINGTLSTFEKKVIVPEALLFKRITGDLTITAIVRNKMGVNISADGIFSMSDDQVRRYEDEMMIVPEIDFLGADYTLEYLGLSKLDDTTNVNEIRITNSDGVSEVRAYNDKSGLLSIVMSSNKQLTKFSDYKEIDGVLFPFTERKGNQIFLTKDISINEKIKMSEFEWNNKIELSLIGEWIARKNVNSSNQTEFTEIKMNENRGGIESMGVFLENGEKETVDLLTQNIIGWEFSNDTIKFSYYNSFKRQVYSKNLVLKSRNKTELIGYFYDPEMDKTMTEGAEEFEPKTLIFRRNLP